MVEMLDASELVIAVLVIAALAETFYLRKEFEEHELSFWVYAAFPLMCLTSLVIVMWHELPDGTQLAASFYLAVLCLAAFFAGLVMALRRKG